MREFLSQAYLIYDKSTGAIKEFGKCEINSVLMETVGVEDEITIQDESVVNSDPDNSDHEALKWCVIGDTQSRED